MLTLKYPKLMPLIYGYPGGLLPVRHPETDKLLLVIKAPKEYILAAQLKGGLSFYLAPLMSTSGMTVALATAFFDDDDEPLIIQTAIFDDPDSKNILELLSYDDLDIHFLDEHNREWMSHRASLRDGGSVIVERTPFGLLTYHDETVTGVYASLAGWFGDRTPADDDKAIKAVFEEELFPSDIFISDIRPELHDYLGSDGHSRSTLEREDAGYFQERDIDPHQGRQTCRRRLVGSRVPLLQSRHHYAGPRAAGGEAAGTVRQHGPRQGGEGDGRHGRGEPAVGSCYRGAGGDDGRACQADFQHEVRYAVAAVHDALGRAPGVSVIRSISASTVIAYRPSR